MILLLQQKDDKIACSKDNRRGNGVIMVGRLQGTRTRKSQVAFSRNTQTTPSSFSLVKPPNNNMRIVRFSPRLSDSHGLCARNGVMKLWGTVEISATVLRQTRAAIMGDGWWSQSHVICKVDLQCPKMRGVWAVLVYCSGVDHCQRSFLIILAFKISLQVVRFWFWFLLLLILL